MNVIRKPLKQELIAEHGCTVAFFDNLRVKMDDETKIDEPVLDENGNKIYDLFVMVCPDGDPFSEVVKLAEDSVKKAAGDKSFEGKTSIIDAYGESRLVPLTKFYKKAYDTYLARKNQPAQLSEAEIELAKVKAQLAEIQAKQSAAALENEAPKPVKSKSKAKNSEQESESQEDSESENEGEKSNKIKIVE